MTNEIAPDKPTAPRHEYFHFPLTLSNSRLSRPYQQNTQNSKSEYRNPKQTSNSNDSGLLPFWFVSNFEPRASSLKFLLSIFSRPIVRNLFPVRRQTVLIGGVINVN